MLHIYTGGLRGLQLTALSPQDGGSICRHVMMPGQSVSANSKSAQGMEEPFEYLHRHVWMALLGESFNIYFQTSHCKQEKIN